ncbi:hypothetical protein G7Y89_g15454 [Cudoniella acicularis]|uniref:Glucose-methanol-choline oxidoreductase C-terminal domain-containing protein n=1 Tax=Cudoniella acicularis TaxID=354080 RepID=A0A8H4QM06_9HELO|nr:hypothetical protein G7Y89_g15454 [Cudoniella acicularis]
MWDNVCISSSYAVNVETATLLMNTSSPYTYAAGYNFKHRGTGPLTNIDPYLSREKPLEPHRSQLSNSTLQALSKFSSHWPEVEYIVDPLCAGIEPMLLGGASCASIAYALVSSLSQGDVTIISNSTDLPIINPNLLSDLTDIELAIATLKRQRTIWKTPEMKPVVIGEEVVPSVNVSTDAQLVRYFRETTRQLYHASYTCKMGVSNDSLAGLNSKARVFGVSELRVVDASSFPFLHP